ncbi:adhesion G protein-coupled receptor E3-like [Paramisgurnus dabryanus]|uniref:adhesion G protein-coupled receptor E3-like n=1 Tax=Paramisgurnus dabryanus TaxID=90735 RepID=UPI003CCF154C
MASKKLTCNEVVGLIFADNDSEGEYLPSEDAGDSFSDHDSDTPLLCNRATGQSESVAIHQAQMMNPLPNVSGGNVTWGRIIHRVSRRVTGVGNEAGDPCNNYTVLNNSRRSTNYYSTSYMCDTSVTWVGWYRLYLNGRSTQMPETCVAVNRCDDLIADPCYNCTVLDNVWRATNYTPSSYMCDTSVNWVGWYRLYLNGQSTRMPEKCVEKNKCGTQLPLWLSGGHPKPEDGVVVRDDVTILLDMVLSVTEKINSSDPKKQASDVLKVSEKLVSMLVKPTNTYDNVSFTSDTLEAQVFMVGPQANLNKIPHLNTTNASIDIDLIGIAKNNLHTMSAAVDFISYNTMEDLLKPNFFNKSDDTVKTMMSTIISATLPKTNNTTLTKPVNFTLKHIREFVSGGNLSCVYWNISEWIVDGCSIVQTNSNYTVCSCLHLSTFALIMETSSSPLEDGPLMKLVNLVFVIVGLVFTSLALLTFAFCRWKPGVNNVARINLCISLLSAHLLFLLSQQFLTFIKPHEELCAVISGALHFFFLSCFVWMFIEAVLLFIFVKNLSQISSKQRVMLSSGFLIVIGYVIAFVIVGVSVGLVPEGYGSEQCWIKQEKGFIWSFLGPVCFILAINTILFISIIINLNSTLKKLNAEVSQMKQTKIMVFKTLAQFVILGCPWILGFFINNNQMMQILFLILNSQQGTFIFLVYCVFSDEVRQQYVKWMTALLP